MRTRGHPVFPQGAASVSKSQPLLAAGRLSLKVLQEIVKCFWEVEGTLRRQHHLISERERLPKALLSRHKGKECADMAEAGPSVFVPTSVSLAGRVLCWVKG